jgi:hypothetical protein
MTLAAILCGLLLGVIAAAIWTRVNSWFGEPRFWPAVAQFTKTAVSGADDADFLRQYLALLRELGVYVGRNLLAVLLAFLPVTLFIIVAGPPAGRYWNASAERITVYPPQDMTVTVDGESRKLGPSDGEFPRPADREVPLTIVVGDSTLECRSAAENWAFTSSPWRRMVLASLDFDTTDAPGQPDLLIVRPSRGDGNFFWPYLNDLEFACLAALSVASLVGMVAFRARKKP